MAVYPWYCDTHGSIPMAVYTWQYTHGTIPMAVYPWQYTHISTIALYPWQYTHGSIFILVPMALYPWQYIHTSTHGTIPMSLYPCHYTHGSITILVPMAAPMLKWKTVLLGQYQIDILTVFIIVHNLYHVCIYVKLTEYYISVIVIMESLGLYFHII